MKRFERWLEVRRIFEEALEFPPEERAAFLDRACLGDEELRREIDALLKAPPVPTASLAGLLGLPERREEPDYAEGDTIDHFTIVRYLGRGGMGVVYEARDARNNNRPVALKVLFSQAVNLSQDKRLAGFSSPTIVTFHDSGETSEGLPYFVFEYIEGEPITTFCENRNLSLPERLRLFGRVCEALAYAHQRLVIHCDLKPENILVTATGVLKLLDFGIARQVGEEITSRDFSPMTLPFASPEQVGGEETTTLSDVYSLGVLLCVLLTGRLPYGPVRSVADLHDVILYQEPVRPSDLVRPHRGSASEQEKAPPLYCLPPSSRSPEQLARHLRGDLDAIVSRALSKEPSKRYASVAELAEDIRRHLAIEPVDARPASPRYRMSKFLHRRAAGLAIASVISVAFLILSVLLAGQYRRAVEGERQALAQEERTRQVNQFVVNLFRRTNPFDPGSSPDASVDELLDQSSRAIEASSSNPDFKASLLSVLGEIFGNRGNAERGRKLLESALTIQGRGLHDHALAETLQRYGAILGSQGRYQESEAALLRAQEVLENLGQRDPVLQSRILMAQSANKMNLGEYDVALELSQASLSALRHSPESFPDLAASLHGLGRLLELKDRDAEAEALLRQALSYAERMPETRNPHVALMQNALGAVMYKRGDYSGARTMYRRALDINRATLGEDSMAYALTLHNIAALDSVQGQYQDAREKFTQVVATLHKSLPPNHLRILNARGQLASTLVCLQEYRRAEQIFLEVLAIERNTLPKNHPAIATTLNNLGSLYQDEGRLRESQDSYEESLGIFIDLVGRNSRPVATLLGNLGTVVRMQNDDRSAEAHFSEALDIARNIDGGKSPNTVNALANLASMYISTGDLEKARPLVGETTTLAESLVGPTGLLTGSAYLLEAKLFLAQGDPRRALARASQARTILSARLPPQDWRIAVANSVLGAALGSTGDPAEAEQLLLHSLVDLRRIKGGKSLQVREAADRLRYFYKSLGRNDEAKKY